MLATKEEKCTVTMSALKTPIDYKSLEEELHAALAADELYKLQNDAKIRAVEQGVPTYEHFRQLVEGAHLKPLERSDKTPKIGVQWNPMVGTKSRDSTSCTTSEKLVGNKCNSKLAAKKSSETCKKFLQFWENIADNAEKFTYIWNLRNILQSHIFRVEVPASFLSDFIDTCLRYSSNADDVTPITELLATLSTCNRFDLTMCFMTKDEHSRCEQLFQHLQGRSQDDSSKSVLESLAAKYRIK